MSFIEGIGDDILYVFSFLLFIGIISLAWLSTYVNNIHTPRTLFIIERRTHRRNEEEQQQQQTSAVPNSPTEQLSSPNETLLTEHESDIESNEIDGSLSESNISSIPQSPELIPTEEDNQSLRVIIKFLNETQKIILAHPNDTISKVKRLYFSDELANNKIIRFIYQGRELQDAETLRNYNIHDQTIIHCQISPRRHSTPNRIDNDRVSSTHMNSNAFDTSSFLDASPINISSHLILFLTLVLGSVWYLRIKYRVLFTPISTIILILITIIFLIFTCGPLLSRRQVSDTRIQHVHLD